MACVAQNEINLKREHLFISRMIFDGICKATLFHEWKDQLYVSKSNADVIKARSDIVSL